MDTELRNDGEMSGSIQIHVVSAVGYRPIQGAKITLFFTGNPEGERRHFLTDESGQSERIRVVTPPLSYSMEPGLNQPYSEYSILVEAEGYFSEEIAGMEALPLEEALQEVYLTPLTQPQPEEGIVISPHTLYGDYPAKIAEPEIVPMEESGEVVLSRVVIPEYVIVHDGAPSDKTAKNYYVKYKDYIKNVASSEIYATWPDATIRANVLAIMSFALNRVYTEFYRNKGYDFTITSSTAFDQKWIYGRNIYSNISQIVDEMFGNYLSRPNVKQPILTQYCDGKKVTCPNWMSQWGSKYLGDQGYSASQILRYYYGSDIYINEAEAISGVPSSWPGYNLSVGSTGAKVRQMQEELNAIAKAYPAMPKISADGVFGQKTKEAVQKFQSIFGLPANGIVDFPTWYKISGIYVAVTRIAELNS